MIPDPLYGWVEENDTRIVVDTKESYSLCDHLSPEPIGLRKCDSCGSNVSLKVFQCALGIKGEDGGVTVKQECSNCKLHSSRTVQPLPSQAYQSDLPSREVTAMSRHSKPVWQYGITTCDQRVGNDNELLRKTLVSLRGSGFPEPRIFVDGCGYDSGILAHHLGVSRDWVVVRNTPISPFGNWILAAWELWLRNPKADYYAIFQDDMICVKNLREYIEAIDYPRNGYLNLFSCIANEDRFPHDTKVDKQIGFRRGLLLRSGPDDYQKGLGAVALVFSHDAFVTLLSNKSLLLKPLCADKKRAWKCIDGGIVEAMNSQGWFEYVHNPSLVQHLGLGQSSLGNTSKLGVSRTFPGENFDALSLISHHTDTIKLATEQPPARSLPHS